MGLNLCPNSEFFCVKLSCLEEMNVITVCAGLSACCGNLVCGAPTHKSLEFFLKSWICARRGWWTVKNSKGIKNSFIRTGHHSREICGSWMLVQEIWKLGEEEGKNEFWYRRCMRSCRWSWQSSVQEIQEKSLRNPGAVGRAEPGRDGTFHCREEQSNPRWGIPSPERLFSVWIPAPGWWREPWSQGWAPTTLGWYLIFQPLKAEGAAQEQLSKRRGHSPQWWTLCIQTAQAGKKIKIWIDSFQLVLNP